HRERDDAAVLLRPREHAIVRRGARTEPRDVAALRLHRLGRIRVRRHTRDQRGDTRAVLYFDGGFVDAGGNSLRIEPVTDDSIYVEHGVLHLATQAEHQRRSASIPTGGGSAAGASNCSWVSMTGSAPVFPA